MARIIVDGVEHEVEAGQNLLQSVLSRGIDLPYFCWHPALGSVGACRQCAVMQYSSDEDERGRLVMACMTPVADGMRFSVEAAHATDFRRTVVEWLMMSHPHDCPVCEEGGECHLQDMTVMTGHVHRRYRGDKRTWRNQDLGPFINHEMNRCITCYRCVRFYRDYAGGRDLEDFGSRDRVYFGRVEDGVLESEFSGNLVEVCPTGVFTDKPFSAQYTRKWDLQSAPSVCPGCALGCNTLPGERYGTLRRVHNRYHPDINGYFLCDRGRFGQTFVNAPARLRRIGRRRDDVFEAVDDITAVDGLAERLDGARVLGIGSPRASLESNFVLSQLVGAEHYCPGFSVDEGPLLRAALAGLRSGRARLPSLHEVEAADAVLVLGEDPIDSAPRLALSLRQAAFARAFEVAEAAGIPLWQDAGVRSHGRGARHPVYLATVLPSRSADIAAGTRCGSPSQLAAFGREVAAAIGGAATTDALVREVADALRGARRPLIVSGTSLASAAVLDAAQAVIDALADADRDVGAVMLPREANAMGLGMLEAAMSDCPDMESALLQMEQGAVDLLIVVENDLMRRASPQRVAAALACVETVVVLDSVEHDTAGAAHWVLPTAAHVESEGTWINNEGRAQRFFPALDVEAPVLPAWRWLGRLAAAMGREELAMAHVDAVTAACADMFPELAPAVAAAPGADWRDAVGLRVPREPARYSGRTAMRAHLSVHEPRTHQDSEAALSWSMEGDHRPGTPAALTTHYWSPGWNSNQALTRFQQEAGGALKGGRVGVRLLQPGQGAARVGIVEQQPAAAMALVPRQHIFGSDELSALAPAVAERIDTPQLIVSPGTASRLGISADTGVRLTVNDESMGLFVLGVDNALDDVTAVFSSGLPGTPAWLPQGQVDIQVAPDWTPPRRPQLIARG